MSIPFLIIEALTLIGVPVVMAVSINLIIRDARDQKAQRDAEMENLRAEVQDRIRQSTEDVLKAKEEMEAYMERISAKPRLEDLITKRAVGLTQWRPVIEGQHRIVALRGRRGSAQWRQ